MTLDFKEVAPDPKAKKDQKQKPRPAVLAERKGKGPAPLHLDSQVIPTLVRKVGDWKTGRISQAMCEAYLDRNTLVFDRELLTKMFTEADYQKEGSLDTRALTIAISGRFPKREHTADWRTLTAMLLGLPELVLTDDQDVVLVRTTAERAAGGGKVGGTYNSGNIWDSPPPPLPPVRRRRSGSGRPASSGTVTAKEPSASWLDTMNRTAAALVAAASAAGDGAADGGGSAPAGRGSFSGMTASTTLPAVAAAGASASPSPSLSPSPPPPGRLSSGYTSPVPRGSYSGGTVRSGSAGGALDATGSLAGGAAAAVAAQAGVVGTTGGLRQISQTAEEQRLNASLGVSGLLPFGGDAPAALSSFDTLRMFNNFSRGLELTPQLAADSSAFPQAAAGGPAGLDLGSMALGGEGGVRTASRLGSPKEPVRVWAAPLPPSAISLPSSALKSLRESVRSTALSKPEFGRSFMPLNSHDLDLKRTLGQDMDMQKSLARVEPVRDTKVLPRADYVAWCDYAANCRTGPSGWYERHPIAVVQDSGDHKYPWC
ncbi:hypothetical protein Agub_g14615 [Astrephomene gubernaculifera]|uniref:Uncharacterized protein n=1 Tax=Astrephomene gubernaculifera TaxID=47775 RepID=A0AAD3HTB4_9CHLO|nr:hypothetical protein Agub_g14615 [Astrephomene gubernaculifera]